jgi:3-methyl-2-oxobutanoate hydroxymethyltransferase
MDKVTASTLLKKKMNHELMTWLAVYDYQTAQIAEDAEIDIILMGDSIGMNVFGHKNTLQMTMDILIPHTLAVRKGAPNVFLIGDMPFMSYQIDIKRAIKNAGRFIAECDCDAIKIEGGEEVIDTVAAIIKATIPVVGHIGLTPQAFTKLGGFKAQGRTAEAAMKIICDAKALEETGVCMIVLEAVPAEVAKIITEKSNIPIIGVGCGPYVDGQCLAVSDVLGMLKGFRPKFVKAFANIREQTEDGIKQFVSEVKNAKFPLAEHCYDMPKDEIDKLHQMMG